MKTISLWLGIDRAVFFTLVARGWNAGAGLITILVISHFLSPMLQGYYYTFNSLIALQIFAELGLNFAIVQFSSHEMAKLTWLPDGTVSGDLEAKRRLQSLMHFALTWFGVAALLMIVVLLPVGLYFFKSQSARTAILPNVNIPWMILVILTATNLFIAAAAAILEGCGKVSQIAVLRLMQSLFSVSVIWLVIALGGNLYALTASSLMTALTGFAWLWIRHRMFFKDLISHRMTLPGMSWRKEIWPFQWRIAVSWASGYLIFQLFNPILFKTNGPIVAGQMGMSLQIIGAMNGAALSWITTKAPIYGQLIATNQRRKFDAIFFRGLRQSSVFLIMCVTMVWLLLYHLHQVALPYANRVLTLPLFSLLCLVCIANHIVFSEAAYLRAHKEEPFMGLSVLTGIAIATLAFLLIPSLGATGAVYAYTGPSLLISLIGGTTIFILKRREYASHTKHMEKCLNDEH